MENRRPVVSKVGTRKGAAVKQVVVSTRLSGAEAVAMDRARGQMSRGQFLQHLVRVNCPRSQ